jgi:hypothetical protein
LGQRSLGGQFFSGGQAAVLNFLQNRLVKLEIIRLFPLRVQPNSQNAHGFAAVSFGYLPV